MHNNRTNWQNNKRRQYNNRPNFQNYKRSRTNNQESNANNSKNDDANSNESRKQQVNPSPKDGIKAYYEKYGDSLRDCIYCKGKHLNRDCPSFKEDLN